jgi:CRISPR/Cas system endoribonuclease Cas6 (RAMP superfamily)
VTAEQDPQSPVAAAITTGTLPATLPLARYRFTARVESELQLPDYAGSLLRGVFGAALRQTACMTGLPDCKACPLWRSCPYPAIFETPPQPTQFAQQFSQVPNPYVIEPPAIGNRRVEAGAPLVFHMVLIGADTLRQLPLIVHAWQRAFRLGLGHDRVVGELVAVDRVVHQSADGKEDALGHKADVGSAEPVYDAQTARVLPHRAELSLAVPDTLMDANAVTLAIVTPLRLQREGHALGVHELSPRTLIAQLLRRANLMLDLHLGIRPAPFDAHALLALAESLTDDRSALHWKDWTRYSARQRQEMTLGGVLGRWTLRGDLAPLLPWFTLGEWLHLGKNTSMGLGGYRIERTDAHATAGTAP